MATSRSRRNANQNTTDIDNRSPEDLAHGEAMLDLVGELPQEGDPPPPPPAFRLEDYHADVDPRPRPELSPEASHTSAPLPPLRSPTTWFQDVRPWLESLPRRPIRGAQLNHVCRMLGCGRRPPPVELTLPDPDPLESLTSGGFAFGTPIANSFDTVDGVVLTTVYRILRLADLFVRQPPFDDGEPVVLAYIYREQGRRRSMRVRQFAIGFARGDTGMPEDWYSYDPVTLICYQIPDLRAIDDFVLFRPV
jgi:hypothetical protein